MATVDIRDDDYVLVHREGVDYKTAFKNVAASLPGVEIADVLTYRGIADGTGDEPDQVLADIYLLILEGDPAPWVPDGAKHGDYLTWAPDVTGASAWRLMGNVDDVDLSGLVTQEEFEEFKKRFYATEIDTELNSGHIEKLWEKTGEIEGELGELENKLADHDHEDIKQDLQIHQSLISQNGLKLGQLQTELDEHNHDEEYLKLSGGTVTGTVKIDQSSGSSFEVKKGGELALKIWSDGTVDTTKTDFDDHHLVSLGHVKENFATADHTHETGADHGHDDQYRPLWAVWKRVGHTSEDELENGEFFVGRDDHLYLSRRSDNNIHFGTTDGGQHDLSMLVSVHRTSGDSMYTAVTSRINFNNDRNKHIQVKQSSVIYKHYDWTTGELYHINIPGLTV